MIRFVPWSEVGTITVSPGDNVVEVGAFELAEGADTLWVRMTNTGTPGPWPWSYGILSFKTEEGQPLGSIKAYNSFDGEVFRLGVGLPPSVRAGVLTFEPRGFNMAWIKQGNPWSLKFEAQSGGGTVSTSYWNRDPVGSVLSPVTANDNVNIGSGDFTAGAANFLGDLVLFRDYGTAGNPSLDVILYGGSGLGGRLDLGYESQRAYLKLARSDVTATDNFAITVGTSSAPDQAFKVTYAGVASFAGRSDFLAGLNASDVVLRSSDLNLYKESGYEGPELSLLDEIARLEGLVKELYERLRMAPEAGWEVWDGNEDLMQSNIVQSRHI